MLYPCFYSASAQQKYKAPVTTSPGRAVNITRKEKEYRGMLEYREGDETRLVKKLVTGMLDLFCSIESFFASKNVP